MPRRCSICSRPDAGSIALLLAEGRSARSVAAEYGIGEDALQHHRRQHLAARELPRSTGTDVPVTDPADPLDELVAALRVRALAGNPSDTREYRLALAAQADARHAAPPTRDLASEPEWIALRTRLLDALEPYPEVRQAVVVAIEDI